MDLVENYDSESDSESIELPAVPAELLDKYHKAPSSSMKYKIIFTPPLGYFNSYCSLEFLPNSHQLDLLSSVFKDVLMYQKMSPLLKSLPRFTPLYLANGINTQIHISLTNNLFLKREEKSKFQAELKTKLLTFNYKNDFNLVSFDKIRFFYNSERTKIFLTLNLSPESQNSMLLLNKAINDTLEGITDEIKIAENEIDFTSRNYHISIGETSSNSEKDEFLQELNDEITDLEITKDLQFTFDSIKVNDGTSRLSLKIGNYKL